MHKCLTSPTRLRAHAGSIPESALQPERSGLRWGRGGEGKVDHRGDGVHGLPHSSLCPPGQTEGLKGDGNTSEQTAAAGSVVGAHPSAVRRSQAWRRSAAPGLDWSQGGRLFSQARQSDRGAWPSSVHGVTKSQT